MQEHLPAKGVPPDTIASACRSSSGWQPAIDESLRNQALDIIRIVAERLCDPEAVTTIAQRASQQTTGFWAWSPSSLSSGFGSTALLFLFLARSFPDQGWKPVARQHLRLAAEFTHQQPFMAPGVFLGSSGLATAVSFFEHDDSRYRQTMQALNERVAEQVLQRQWQREPALGVADSDYDTVMGASGILGYLVTINPVSEQARAAIHRLLEYLIWLAGSDEEQGRKRWFLPPELYPIELHRKSYPDGYFNCGLAHGIPGPLAALAIAWHAGYRVPGQSEAMRSLAQWVIERPIRDAWGINWPGGIPLQQSYSSKEWSTLPPSRAAWCYGAPGIARALWLAGTALDDADLCQISIEAIESVLRRPIAARGIDSVSFCHGVAGLLTICLHFAHETHSVPVRQHIPQLVRQVLNGFDPAYPLGFRDLEQEDNQVDDPGLLTGAAGIALALLAASTSIPPVWDRIFLIA